MDDLEDSAASGRGWLAKADDDLRVAGLVLSGGIGVEWAACFPAQQAAEKALKGVLVHLGVDFPKSHNVGWLGATATHAAFEIIPTRVHETGSTAPRTSADRTGLPT